MDNCVAITSGKGGVLKTSIATHLSAFAAAQGWRVLLVDGDPQGNTVFDLGYRSDGGQGLAEALSSRRPLVPQRNVRPNLDVVAGGRHLDPEIDRLVRSSTWRELEIALHPLAVDYDLIVIDSPARELAMRRAILTASRFVIVPSALDRASEAGLADLADTVRIVRDHTNPGLDVLAVVAAPIAAGHSRVRDRATTRLGELIGDPDLVCGTVVRHSSLVAEQCRAAGLLSQEYATGVNGSALSSAAAGVADDWSSLCAELLSRLPTGFASRLLAATN